MTTPRNPPPAIDDGEARTHALTASEYLAAASRYEERVQALDAEERLQMVAMGGFARVNADLEWTVKLAAIHALTAIALAVTEDE